MRLLLALAAALPACATIGTPSRFRVPIDSVPPGALVLRDGKELGRTPITVEFGRVENPTVTLRADGYHNQAVQVENKPAPMGLVLIDCILFPLLIIDVASGVDHQVDTTPLSVHLTPAGSPPPPIWRRSDYETASQR